jgi:NADPH:quinone reductase-like Zn-dependent oxidoreductase
VKIKKMLRQTTVVQNRTFATLRQVVLKKNSGSPFEAFDVAPLKSSPTIKDKSVKLKLLGSVVTGKDVDVMRSSADAVGKPAGQVGLFEVLESSGVSRVQKGDKVRSTVSVGAWQSELVAPESSVSKVNAAVSAKNFADFLGHAQAVQLLKGLKAGDTVAVSEAQSPLGLGVIRVGKKMGLKVVAIVAPRAQSQKAFQRLKDAGADIVAAEEYVDKSYVVSQAFRRLVSDIPKTKLVISGVGSLVAHELARTLGPGGVMYVTGGAPFTLPASLFTERKITLRGLDDPSAADFEEAATMLSNIDSVQTPTVEFDLGEVAKAVDAVGFGPVSLLKA